MEEPTEAQESAESLDFTLDVSVQIHSSDGVLDTSVPVVYLIRNYVDLVRFAQSIIQLDDPDPESPGGQRRKTITLSQIIEDAQNALYSNEE